MERLTLKEIASAMDGRIIKGDPLAYATGISIDSRSAKSGDVFFALIGEFNDAHKYIGGAYEAGSRVFVISEEGAADKIPDDGAAILVENTLTALQELSSWYIDRIPVKKVAVTGSVGKTTTRDMVYSILRRKYITGTSKANLNSETGLPLTLLSFTQDMNAAVVEMGMDGEGQIRRLAEITKPDIGVITNIGISHIERLGSRDNIFKAKMEIAEEFDEDNTLIINADDDKLSAIDRNSVPYRIISAGLSEDADFRATDVVDLGDKGVRFNLVTEEGTMPIRLAIPGAHNAVNAAIAAAAASAFGVALEDIPAGLSHAEMTGNRLRIVASGDVKIIDDSYNAAPESMESAINTLVKSEGNRKVAILGAMNELGEESEGAHKQVGKFAASKGIDVLITIGEKGKQIAEGAENAKDDSSPITILKYDSKEDLINDIKNVIRPFDTVLIKASRTIELEKVSARIEAEFK